MNKFSDFLFDKDNSLKQLELENISKISKEYFIIEKYNWDYLEAYKVQKLCVDYVRQNPKIKILIFTNHPHCFTIGKGLQKNQDLDGVELVDFDPILESQMKFPVHHIFRGGGLTFHYPGQLVVYPIINLTKYKTSVYKIMSKLLNSSKTVLAHTYSLNELDCNRKLLGLWYKNHKIASVGLATSRYITYHGLALNILKDNDLNDALKICYPCGLPGNIYLDIESIVKEKISVKQFSSLLVNEIICEFSKL